MHIVRTLIELRAARRTPGTLAFVPTMGNLHAGHIRLVDRAHEHAAHVAASVFVNRLQFAPNGMHRPSYNFLDEMAPL